jgi:flagellar biosynthesis/type III secretory pathway chaperone
MPQSFFSSGSENDAMSDEKLLAIGTALGSALEVVERINAFIDYENNLLLCDEQATSVLNNATFQEKKTQLYQKFEDMARIITHMARRREITDEPKIRRVIGKALKALEEMQRIVSINNLLLRAHIDRHQRLFDGIMQAALGKDYHPSLVRGCDINELEHDVEMEPLCP